MIKHKIITVIAKRWVRIIYIIVRQYKLVLLHQLIDMFSIVGIFY